MNQRDLALAYSPGVARANLVAVIASGTTVHGLGIGWRRLFTVEWQRQWRIMSADRVGQSSLRNFRILQ